MHRIFRIVACCLTLSTTARADNDDDDLPMGGVGGMCHVVPGQPMIVVKSLIAGAPGDAAGLKVGDFITAVHGRQLGITAPSTQRFTEGYKGAVQDFGIGLDMAQGGNGQLPMKVLRPGVGEVSLNLTLPVIGATGVAFPNTGGFKDLLFERACADIHAKVGGMGANLDDISYPAGFFGLIMLSHPNWNVTTGGQPYGNTINKLRDYAAYHVWYKSLYDPSTASGQGSGGDNWCGPQMLMFLSEYKMKAGNVSFTVSNLANGGTPSQTVTISQVIQRGAEILRNRIQDGESDWQVGPWNGYSTGDGNFIGGHTGHGGHLGEYADDLPRTVTGCLNATAVHILPGLSWAWRSGADFSASQLTQVGKTWTVQQKWDRCWEWMKASTLLTAGSTGNERGSIGYMGTDEGWDSAVRSSGAYFGFMLHTQERNNATADDTLRSGYQREYIVRNWQRQQHAHAYTLGGYVFTQLATPYFSQREQSYVRENSRFYYTMMRNPDGSLGYFGGRGNNGGDSYCGFDNVRMCYAGLPGAIGSGNLPTLPAPVTTRLLADFKSPWVAWPNLTAREVRTTNASENFTVDIRDGAGNLLAPGTYTAAWTHVSGPATATFTSPSTANTTANFPSNGTYQIQLVVSRAGYPTITEPISVIRSNATVPVAPSIVTQPLAQNAAPGGSATFGVTVAGTGPIVYQWRLDGVAYWGTSASNTITIPNISPGAAGLYDCVITTPTSVLVSNAVPLTLNATPVRTLGGLNRTVWNNNPGGAIADLTGDLVYPRFPDASSVPTTAETPLDSGDNYGERLSGWILPPTTGNYRFFLSCDDSAELWLSTDDTPANKVRIINQTGWSNFRDYNSSSANISLTAGQRYYIEILHKEGGGGDHVSVAWQLPGGAAPASGSAPIDGTYLEYTNYILFPDDQWKLDDTAGSTAVNAVRTSLNGTHQNGTLVNQTGATTGTGKSAYYDGVNDLTSIPAPNYNTNTLTIAAWVRRNGNVPGWGPIVFSRAGNTAAGFGCGDANELRYHWNDDQWGWNSGLVLPDSQWALAVLVVRPTGATMYLRTASGLQTAIQPATTLTAEEFDGLLSIGTEYVGSSRFFKGNIDDVRIYKSALSSTVVEKLWTDAQNPPPQFTATGPFSVSESAATGSVVGTVTATDPGQTISYAISAGNSGNRFAINPSSGQITVAAPLDFESLANYTLTVTAADNGTPIQTSSTSVLINVTNANEAPVFTTNPINLNATEDSAFSGQLTATDVDAGDTLTYSKVSGPTWLNVASNGALSGTPGNADGGANNFTVKVTDTAGANNTATLNITVANVNDAPTWAGGSITKPDATAGSAYAGSLAADASDVDAGDTLTYSKISGPSWLAVAANGALSGTPSAGNTGANAFTVRVTDAGGLFADATLNIAVIAPTSDGTWTNLTGGSWLTAGNWNAGTIALGANRTANFNTLNLTADAAVTLDGARTLGNLTFGDTTPSHNWTLNTGSGGPLTLDVSSGAPTITVNNQSATLDLVLAGTKGLNKAGAGILILTGNNTCTGATTISGGTLVFKTPNFSTYSGGQININNGSTMQLEDGGGAHRYDFGTLTYNFGASGGGRIITVGGDMNWVSQGNWTFRTNGGAKNTIAGAAWMNMNGGGHSVVLDITRGSDPLSDLDISIVIGNTNGSLTKTGTGIASLFAASNYTGPTSVNDGTLLINGSLANTATTVAAVGTLGGTGTLAGAVSINGTLAPGNNSVGNITVNNTVTLANNSAVNLEFTDWTGTAGTGWDKLTATSLDITATSANPISLRLSEVTLANFAEANTSFVIVQTTSGITGFSADKFIIDDSALTTPQGSWTVQQSGNDLVLAYTRHNTTPAFTADPIIGSATEDSAIIGSISANDPDLGEFLTYTKDSGPAWLSIASNGALSGTPANSDVGVNTFSVRVTDSFGAEDTATLQITVANTNDAPGFISNPIFGSSATEDGVYSASVAGTATDMDAGDTLTFSKVSGPAWLNVAANGALSGTPANNNVGANAFTIRATDGSGAFANATLNINVTNTNDAPAFTGNPITGSAATEDSAYSASLAGSATDVDAGDTLTFSKVSGPAWLSVASNGALSGTPVNAEVGTNAFTIRVTDASGAFANATLNISVANTNDAPVFTVDPILKADGSMGTAYTGQTLAGSATDVDTGATLTYSKVSGPAWLSVASSGALSGTPPSGSTGLNTFIVRVTDNASATDDAELRINVQGLPLPWINGDIGTGMLAGSTSHSSGTFTEAGSGALGGTTDKLQFAYQTLSGDGEIIARISALQNTGTSSRVGVMIRDTLATNSKQIFMGLTSSGSYRWVRRTTTGGTNSTNNSSSGTVPNTWVRLVRVGNTITAYKGSDGTSWTTVGSTTVTLAANCYIGLAVSSGNNTTLNTSQFSNVSVTP